MSILGGADCRDEFGEIAAMEVWPLVEEGYTGRVPGSRYERAGPKGGLIRGPAGYEGQYVRDDF